MTTRFEPRIVTRVLDRVEAHGAVGAEVFLHLD
jgi:hypothetical protein